MITPRDPVPILNDILDHFPRPREIFCSGCQAVFVVDIRYLLALHAFRALADISKIMAPWAELVGQAVHYLSFLRQIIP